MAYEERVVGGIYSVLSMPDWRERELQFCRWYEQREKGQSSHQGFFVLVASNAFVNTCRVI
jgi:hypothetical protein